MKLFIISFVFFISTFSIPVSSTEISFSAVGDMIFGRAGNHFGLDDPFRFVTQYFKGKDIVFGNLETPITSKRYRMSRKPRICKVSTRHCNPKDAKRYARLYRLTFYGRPKAAKLLKTAGFTLLGTANNHAEDQGSKGLLETIKFLHKNGLSHVGSGATPKEAWKPYIFEKKGVKVGIIAATELWNFPPMKRKGYYAFVDFPKIYKELPKRVAKLKKKTDFVVVALHFGEEYVHGAYGREKRLIKKLAAAGMDLFVGSHPHVLRGIQIIGKSVVFWSLGNFNFDNTRGPRGESAIAQLDFVKDSNGKRMKNITFYPVRLNLDPQKRSKVVTGKKAKSILKKVLRYSRTFRNKKCQLKIINDVIKIDPYCS